MTIVIEHVEPFQLFKYRAQNALNAGAKLTNPRLLEWDVSNGCEQPIQLRIRAKHMDSFGNVIPLPLDAAHLLKMKLRCRKCETCKQARAFLWHLRIMSEYELSCRTWLGTLTLNPYEHYKITCRIHDFYKLDSRKQLAERHRLISKEITKYLKRVRKRSNSRFRYFLALEEHQNGLPHYHILIHEPFSFLPVRKRILQEAWLLGFTNFKLCDDAAGAAYVSKYLSKGLLARVRASQDYGNGISVIDGLKP